METHLFSGRRTEISFAARESKIHGQTWLKRLVLLVYDVVNSRKFDFKQTMNKHAHLNILKENLNNNIVKLNAEIKYRNKSLE